MRKRSLLPWRDSKTTALELSQPFTRMRQEMDRLFDEFWQDFELPLSRTNGHKFMPPVDVEETDEAFKVTVELPGTAPEDVEVTVVNNMLTIKGEKKAEREEKSDGYYRLERSFGAFARTIPLPADLVDDERVEAKFENGILTISLPKRPEAKVDAKAIPITVA